MDKKKETRRFLEEERERLSRRLGALRPVAGETDMGRVLSQRTRAQLDSVVRALEKLDDGTYGLCDACGRTIPVVRLEALPQANLCLECKTKT